MRNARNDDGFALITAIILLTVMLGLGLGLLFLTDSQQKASSREQSGESAFNVAEAALNAQIGQLSHSWPSQEGNKYPKSCTQATAGEPGCPTAESLKVGYPSSSANCSAGTQKDAWGSPLTNEWTTYVRDDVSAPAQLFNSTEEVSAGTYAASGQLWVRSVGVVQCRVVVLIALVSPQIVAVPFPQTAIAGNWFETSNNGAKIIVNTKGKASQSGGIGMRCKGTIPNPKCEEFRTGQVSPDTTVAAPPEQTLSASQLESVKNLAKAAVPSRYFAAGTCPKSLAEVSGGPVYVEGPCNLSFTGNGTANTLEKPGFLVLANGTFQLNATTTFYGTVYAVNAQKSSGVVVELHGHSHLVGSIVVDGNGGLSFGSSGNGGKKEEEVENFVYNNVAVNNLEGFVGASATRNSFRVLPNSQ
jgi:Tfp pilus assembly protein PilX